MQEMIRAIVFNEYGGPEVLRLIQQPLLAPAAGQLQVRVRAAGVQPFDTLLRAGKLQGQIPVQFPQQLGNEFAGVVEATGEGVTDFAPGDEVLGWAAQNAYADALLVDEAQVVRKPAGLPWAVASVLSGSGQMAATALDELRVGPGDTLLIHAAAGGVGSFATQLARARGARVIGTASPRNHAYLQGLGAEAVAYGPGLTERVRALAPDGVSAALVAVATEEAFLTSQQLVPDPQRRVSTVFHPLSKSTGVRRIATQRSQEQLQALVNLHMQGQLKVRMAQVFPLAEAAEAHRLVQDGHAPGKVALSMENGG